MNRLLLLILLMTGMMNIIHSDELDDIISHSLTNSLTGQSLINKQKQAGLVKQSRFLTLIPNLSVDADFDGGASPDVDYSIYLSESFSDVDQVIQNLRMAESKKQRALIDVELQKRSHIDTLIGYYVDLSLMKKRLEITRADLENQKILYNIMKVRQENGREIMLNVDKQQNEIVLSEADLGIEEITFANQLRVFLDLSGGANADFTMRAEFKDQNPVTDHELVLRKGNIDLSNNRVDTAVKKREQWLPRLDLSASWSYDIDAGYSSYSLGAGLSFSALDYWERKNDIRQMEITAHDIRLSLSNNYVRWQNDKLLMESRIKSLKRKIKALEKEVELDKKLQNLYKYQYETDQIDYHEYRRRQNVLLTSELNLLRLQGDYMKLRKRLQYGILKP